MALRKSDIITAGDISLSLRRFRNFSTYRQDVSYIKIGNITSENTPAKGQGGDVFLSQIRHKFVTNSIGFYRFLSAPKIFRRPDFSRKYVLSYFLSALVGGGGYVVKHMENTDFSANLRRF